MSNNKDIWRFFHDDDGGHWHGHHHGRSINGSSRDDVLTGTARNDEIRGGGGNDQLYGGGGNDRLDGGRGNDRLEGGGGSDWIDGGKGFDTAVYSGAFSDYRFLLFGHHHHARYVIVMDQRDGRPDGIDWVTNVEALQFADFTLFLDGRNNAPHAVADVATMDEDHALLVSGAVLVSNDIDLERDDLTVTGVTLVSGGGSVALVGGDVSFDPGADYRFLAVGESAATVLEYTVSDERGALDTALITVTVTGVNDGPEANADTATTDEDHAVTVDVLANDTDADDGTVLTVSGVSGTSTAGALVSLSSDGAAVTYDASGVAALQALAAGEQATDTFTYTISDGDGGNAEAEVTVVVQGVNDAPVAADDSAATLEDVAVSGNVLGNDTDAESDALTLLLTGTFATAHGSVSIGANGNFAYAPVAHFSGSDSFNYVVSDGRGGTDTGTVTIAIQAVADAPTLSVPAGGTALYAGFNSGFVPWEVTGLASIVATHTLASNDPDIADDANRIARPTEGTAMARLQSGPQSDTDVQSFLGLPAGALDALNAPGNATEGSAMRTTVALDSGQAFSFDWRFAAHDTLQFNDFAFFSVDDPGPDSATAVELADIQAVGALGNSGWQTFTYTAGQSGTYTFGLGVFNVVDMASDSFLLVDRVRVSTTGVTGNEDTAIPLAIASALVDMDGSESLSIVISGAGAATLNHGTNLGGGNWSLTPADLAGLTITSALNDHSDLALSVTATSTESSNGSTASTTRSLQVIVNSVNDAPVAEADKLVIVPIGSEEVSLNIAAPTDVDGHALTATILAAPANGTLEKPDGTLVGSGAILSAAELAGLVFTPIGPVASGSLLTYSVSDGNGGSDVASVSISLVDAGGSGTPTPVSLAGGAGNDVLVGGGADDVLTGNAGNDLLDGGAGSDTFDYNSIGDGTDRVSGFVAGAGGDALDISDVLVGYDPATSLAADFVRLVESGGDTLVSVNADGIGDDFVPLVILQGITGLGPNDLLNDGNLMLG